MSHFQNISFNIHKNSVSGKENDKSSLISLNEYENQQISSTKKNLNFSSIKSDPENYYSNIQPIRLKSHSLHNSENKRLSENSRNLDNYL